MSSDFIAEILGVSRIGISSDRLNAVAALAAKRRVELIADLIKTDGFHAFLATLIRNPTTREIVTPVVQAVEAAIRAGKTEESTLSFLGSIKRKAIEKIRRRYGYDRPEVQVGADVAGDQAQAQLMILKEAQQIIAMELHAHERDQQEAEQHLEEVNKREAVV